MLSLVWKCLEQKLTGYILGAGEIHHNALLICKLHVVSHHDSMNASYGVGAYYLNESSTAESPDIYWLNNFNNLYSSVGMVTYSCTICT